MNKKGNTFSGWAEGILFSAIFVIFLGLVITGLNTHYSKSYDSTAGLGQSGSDVIDDFKELESSLETKIEGGEASQEGDTGLTISSLWSLLKITWKTTGSFLTGGWIESAANIANVPSVFAKVLRLLFLISIAFILIKLLLRLKP